MTVQYTLLHGELICLALPLSTSVNLPIYTELLHVRNDHTEVGSVLLGYFHLSGLPLYNFFSMLPKTLKIHDVNRDISS